MLIPELALETVTKNGPTKRGIRFTVNGKVDKQETTGKEPGLGLKERGNMKGLKDKERGPHILYLLTNGIQIGMVKRSYLSHDHGSGKGNKGGVIRALPSYL
jgi:hypothetical protein